tara:strand:+ start:91 stop:819 length:729 start_codon:yes stop_codon:yes gene_type:complete
MKKYILIFFTFILISCSNNATNENSKLTPEEALKKSYPNIIIESINKINNNFYEVIIKDQIFYLTSDYQNIIYGGNLVDLETQTNLTDISKKNIRKEAIANLNVNDMIVYKPKITNHVLTIFTDTSCPYCRKLHNEVGELMKNNIEVRYVLFSRNGNSGDAYTDMVSVWCSKDKTKSLDKIFEGDFIENDDKCSNPISANLNHAQSLSVNGTPMIFTENGDVIPGYQPSASIVDFLKASLAN